MTSTPPSNGRFSAVSKIAPERLGVLFVILLVWLGFEFGRPPNAFKIPMMISIVSFAAWGVRSRKQWTPQSWGFLALLAAMAAGVPFAENTYAAYRTTTAMAVMFLCVCLPLQSLVTTVRRVRVWIYTFLAVAGYVGVFAVFHGGYGPSGAAGAQDENYVAALMGMAIPLAYFPLFVEKRPAVRALFIAAIIIFVGAIALGENPSRGGFVGLCAVALYCLARSPRKALGLTVFLVGGAALLVLAGPAFWAEIRTSTDLQTGTANMRLEIWKIGVRMWKENPLIGVGPDNFRWVIGFFQSPEQWVKFDRSLAGSIIPHSLPVELLSELGIVGVLAAGGLIGWTWVGLGKVRTALSRRGNPVRDDPAAAELRCYADAVRGGILAIMVNGVFLSLLYYSHVWLLVAVGSAVPFVYASLAPHPNPVPESAPTPRPRAKRGPSPILVGQSAWRSRRS